jgi:two-component system C4-dicarboxylate transport sensor histidine kinase DctB
MSAGISHELNQPLTAIRSFAENANAFLDRDQPERASDNLNRISEMARRMGRIIKNLRAFARQEHEALADVSINAAIEAVLEMAMGRIEEEQVTLIWSPKSDVVVRGGEVRLQQVLTNLVSNALDAIQSSGTKELRILVETLGSKVRVSVQDTGPGIVDPERIFDPFYSTKDVGAANGMGLGLSISYGIVQSFGGVIKGRNLEGGGAEFSIELTASSSEVAA